MSMTNIFGVVFFLNVFGNHEKVALATLLSFSFLLTLCLFPGFWRTQWAQVLKGKKVRTPPNKGFYFPSHHHNGVVPSMINTNE